MNQVTCRKGHIMIGEDVQALSDRGEDVQALSDGRWIVARWSERAAQFHAPMTTLERRVTGCHTYCAREADNLSGGYIYARRADALRRARTVYADEGASDA